MLTVKITQDGSTTLFNDELNEHYHSTYGALTESMHVFINNGLLTITKNPIKILEIGYGTGLNAILTIQTAFQKKLTIEYTGIELFPLPIETIRELNFENILNKEYIEVFYQMHQLKWNLKHELTSNFSIEKIKADFNSLSFTEKYDLVYFDAFGPDVQHEMWCFENFNKIYDALNKGGILVTYSSKGTVKKNLRDAGFKINRLHGPPGKRHMIKAVKI